jgi:hypothetical protein
MAAIPEVKTTFTIGGTAATGRELARVEFKTSDEDKKLLDMTKAEIHSRLQAPLQREYQNAMAQLDPIGTLNRRFEAQQGAIKASDAAVNAYITAALKAGVPTHEIQAGAARIAGGYVHINSGVAELAAPSTLTTKAMHVAGISGVSGGAKAPRRRAKPKSSGRKRK